MTSILGYQLEDTLASEDAQPFVEAGAMNVLKKVAELHAEGTLISSIQEEGWKKWTKAVGKELGVKGKNLFMPLRIAFSGRMQGPDLAELVALLLKIEGDGIFTEAAGFVNLEKRLAKLSEVCSK